MPSAKKNPAASALGKLAKDKRKTLTPAALKQRRKASQNAAKARKRRQKQKGARTLLSAQKKKPSSPRLRSPETDFQLPPGPLGSAAHDDEHYNDSD